MVQLPNIATFQQDGHITVNLPGEPPLTAYASTIQAPFSTLSNDFTWEGAFVYDVDTNNDGTNDIKENGGSMTLYRKNNELYGGFWTPAGNWYELMSFEAGKNVLVQYNNAVTAQAHECGVPDNETAATPPERTTGTPCNTKVRVLWVYTDEAAAQIPNIQNAINRAMGDMNGTINNCNAGGGNFNLYFESAGVI